MLDTIRYYLALLTVATLPWAILYWYLIHPFVGFWRRVGPRITYGILMVLLTLSIAVTLRFREPLLAVRYGTGPVLWVAAGVAYLAAGIVERRCRRYLKFRVLVGIPELAAGSGRSELLTEGIYARVRNPRYISVMLGMIAAGLFVNYLSLWILVAATGPALYGIAVLEERELRDRFGEAYIQYCQRVPRFVPRLRSSYRDR